MESKQWKIILFVEDNQKRPSGTLLDEDEMYAFARDISRDINEKYYMQVMMSRVEEVKG